MGFAKGCRMWKKLLGWKLSKRGPVPMDRKKTRFRELGAGTQKTHTHWRATPSFWGPCFQVQGGSPRHRCWSTAWQRELRPLLILTYLSIVLYMQGTGPHSSKYFINIINSLMSYNNSLEIGTVIIPVWQMSKLKFRDVITCPRSHSC